MTLRAYHIPLNVSLIWLTLAFPLFLYANDSEVRWHGEDVRIVSSGRVKMVSEDIRITQRHVGGSTWFVDARYRLQNMTGEEITLDIAFPEPTGYEEKHFEQYRTTVRGEVVDYKTARRLFAERKTYGQAYVVSVTFAPNEVVDLQHTYDFEGTYTVLGPIVEYVTITGKSWSGTIDSARFTITTYSDSYDPVNSIRTTDHYRPDRTMLERVPYSEVADRVLWYNREERYFGDFYGSGWVGEDSAWVMRTTMIFEKEDWIPEDDLMIMLLSNGVGAGLDTCSSYQIPRYRAQFLQMPLRTAYAYLACNSDSVLVAWKDELKAAYGLPLSETDREEEFYRPVREYGPTGNMYLYYPFLRFENATIDSWTDLDRRWDAFLDSMLARRSRGVVQENLDDLLGYMPLRQHTPVSPDPPDLSKRYPPETFDTILISDPDWGILELTREELNRLASFMTAEVFAPEISPIGSSLFDPQTMTRKSRGSLYVGRIIFSWGDLAAVDYLHIENQGTWRSRTEIRQTKVVNLRNGEEVRLSSYVRPELKERLLNKVLRNLVYRNPSQSSFRNEDSARLDIDRFRITCDGIAFLVGEVLLRDERVVGRAARISWEEMKRFLVDASPFAPFIYRRSECTRE